jgi:hypothetical protein
MTSPKPKFFPVTLYRREGESLQEFLLKAYDAYYAGIDYEQMMREPSVALADFLRDLDGIRDEAMQGLAERCEAQMREHELKQFDQEPQCDPCWHSS